MIEVYFQRFVILLLIITIPTSCGIGMIEGINKYIDWRIEKSSK